MQENGFFKVLGIPITKNSAIFSILSRKLNIGEIHQSLRYLRMYYHVII